MATKPARSNAEVKLCARCLDKKPLAVFGDNPKMKSGKKSYCKPCNADLQRIWRKASS